MKKIFYLASIAALAFSSCAKDETTEAQIGAVNGGSKITAAVVADDTRTHLEKVDGAYEIRWSAGDQLGVYAVEGKLKNAAFTLSNDSDGKAVGVFTSQNEVLDPTKEYLAVYPRHQVALFDAVVKTSQTNLNNPSKTVKLINYTDVYVNLPATQYYRNGSFYTGTVPSVSTNFVVSDNGSQLSMQPVVDYLMVNFTSTETIEKIVLTLRNRTGDSTFETYNIAGLNKLATYNVYGEKVYRHYMSSTIAKGDTKANMTNAITLEINEESGNVTCHEPNTYVFAVPGGILGMNKNVEAIFSVYGSNSTTPTLYAAAATSAHTAMETAGYSVVVTNAQLNYFLADPSKAISETNPKLSRVKTVDDTQVYASKLENQVFWANPLNDKGVRTSFEHNPKKDVIIEDEAELLQYLVEYEKGTDAKFARKDAFVCDNYAFDFSEANMKKLSSELMAGGTYTEFQPYIDAYLNGSFPCITEYNNEFNGNGAVITGIEEPLASMSGIFGKIKDKGKIVNVTFDGIVAAEQDADPKNGKMYPGVILGSIEGGAISKVTVKNAEGMAILKKANSANLAQLTVANAEGLNFIVLDMDLSTDPVFATDFSKVWDVYSSVKSAAFGTLDAAGYEAVYLPATADYADLAWYVNTADANLVDGIGAIVGGKDSFAAVAAYQADTNAVSVFVGETSIWTGDKAIPRTYGEWQLVGSTHTKYNVQYITSAEELCGAVAGSGDLYADMDMSYAVNNWATPALNGVLEGNGATIKGINMNVEGVTSFDNSYVAPFVASEVYNLTVDGVSIKITTKAGQVVPAFISGLAYDANRVENVTVKNLAIAGAGLGNNNEQYNNTIPSFIGWLVANPFDITIKNSKVEGVTNEIKGIAALVAHVEIDNNNSAKFDNATATSVSTPQEQLANFWDWNGGGFDPAKNGNVAGTAVGVVVNQSGAAKSIEFTGSTGKPVFLYYNNASSDINVLYDDSKVILKKGDAQYK